MTKLPILPSSFQPALPMGRLILNQPPGDDAVPMDVLFVGAGPAGLAGAIELARLASENAAAGGSLGELQIGVLEKAESLGEHNLSGAVVNPRAFAELFPGLPDSELPLRARVEHEEVHLLRAGGSVHIPTPPTMHNKGNRVASICEMVRWLGERAEAAGVNIFTGFPADALLVSGNAVTGVRTTPSGLNRDGSEGTGYTAPTDVTARATVLCEGTRGMLTQGWREWQGVRSANPALYALGVKEIWEVPRPLKPIVHTLGWPLAGDTFGGSFIYPLSEELIAIGMVVGLDSPDAGLDVHELLQRLKSHKLVRPLLQGGELVEWGAKTIPEGGYYALPERFSGDGLLLAGDAAGLVEVASLKGIHYAMQSGILAARAIFSALKVAADDAASGSPLSAALLGSYDRTLRKSYIVEDLYARRNMRLAFHESGFFLGGAKAALMSVTGGRAFGGMIRTESDAETPRTRRSGETTGAPDGLGDLTVAKLDAVFKSGNVTRDTVPQHLIVGEDIPPELADLYASLCPAGVYERSGDRLVVNSPNCIDCKATDVVGPRWTPREGGSGPKYRRM